MLPKDLNPSGGTREIHDQDSSTHERLLAAIVESSDDAIVGIGLDGLIESWNSSATRLYGYRLEEAIGHSIMLIIPPNLRDEELKILERVRQGERIEHYETVRLSKSGQTVDISLTVSPVLDATGRVMGISKLARDITEHKRAEQELRASEDRFRLAMVNISAGVCMLDLQGLITYVNPAAEKMLGWTNAELLGKKMHDVAHYKHPDGTPFPDSDCAALEALQKGVELREREDEFIGRDGSFFPIVYSVSPLKQGTEIIGAVVGFRDDTERREAERAVNERKRELLEAQRVAHVGSWHWDVKNDVVTWSEELYCITGRDPSSKVPSYKNHSQLFTPESWNLLQTLVARALRSGEPWEGDFDMVRRDGTIVSSIGRGEALRDEHGIVVALRGVVQDITERREFEKSLVWHLHLEKLLSDLSTTFIDLPEAEIDANIGRGLSRIGEFLDLCRITIFEFSEDRTNLYPTHAWSAPGARPAPPTVSTTNLPWWTSQVLTGKVSLMIRPEDLPDEASAEREYFLESGVLSGASIPLKVSGEITGAITFVSTTHQVSWTDNLVSQLTVIGDIFCNALKRKRATEALSAAQTTLRESEGRFRLVANAAPVMIWMSGADKLCTYFNEGWLSFTGKSLEAELGNGWVQGVHPDDLGHCLKQYTAAFDAREPYRIEYRLRRYDGHYRHILSSGVPWLTATGSFAGYIGSAMDITERKQAEEVLSSLSQRLIEAQEEERTWIARELHDDINQRIALLSGNVEELRQAMPKSAGNLKQQIGGMIEELQTLGSDIQALSHRLHSSKLEYLGFEAAASSVCRELAQKFKVKIMFHAQNIPRDLSKDISLSLYRILQESLQNAIKHSGSDHIQVKISGGPREIELTVRESGKGFRPQEAIQGRGLGLISMQERLKLVNGVLSIDSQPGRGTTIHARVPFAHKTKATAATG
jgi:PAS domain S-box-containing protein